MAGPPTTAPADASPAGDAAPGTRIRVLHLTGSPTSAFHADLSRLYAADCLRAIAGDERYEHRMAFVSPDGTWRFPADPGVDAVVDPAAPPTASGPLSRAALEAAPPLDVGAAIGHVVDLGVDVMVPQMFCLAGMTSYRALFDVLGVPFVGNAPDVMALTADKARARAVVAAAGVDVPRGELVRAGERPTIAPPAVVKPVDADNSVGVALVRDAAEYDAALTVALEHADAALVEAYVPLGREVRCGVLEQGGELVGLPLEEYRVDGVRTAEDKIVRHADGELRLMAKDAASAWIVDPADPATAAVHDLARRAFRALGCRHYGLFDVRIDHDGRPWFLEASLYCSFARQSVLCVMADAAGIPTAELFRRTEEELRAG